MCTRDVESALDGWMMRNLSFMHAARAPSAPSSAFSSSADRPSPSPSSARSARRRPALALRASARSASLARAITPAVTALRINPRARAHTPRQRCSVCLNQGPDQAPDAWQIPSTAQGQSHYIFGMANSASHSHRQDDPKGLKE